MKRFLAALIAALSILPTGAGAIQQSSVPPKFPVVWGASAATPYIRSIPQTSQIGIVNCAASLPDGFPPLTFVPASAGGCPPFGQDFNGILKQVTQWSQWYSAGGPIFYDATFATGAANGYPNGAVIQSKTVLGNFWLSTADNNTSDPDAGGANWVPLPGVAQTGSVSWWVGTSSPIPSGWVLAGQTVGNPSSGANVIGTFTQPLFVFMWNNFSNTQCPVSGGRGANAAADFAANKMIQVLPMTGIIQAGNALGTGAFTGVPVISGNVNTNGSLIGETLHTLTVAQIPSHTHNGSGTTGSENANHAHTGAGTTGSENANHTHAISGAAVVVGTSSRGFDTAGVGDAPTAVTTIGPNTGIESVVHQHAYSFTTSAENAVHQHGYSFTTDGGTGGNGSHNVTPRSMIGFWIFKL